MPILRVLTFSYRLSLKLLVRGMLRPLSWPKKLADARYGWSTRDHSPLSTSFHCHPAGKCSLFYEHVQIWVRAISNRNCLIFSPLLCASGRKNIIIIIIIIIETILSACNNTVGSYSAASRSSVGANQFCPCHTYSEVCSPCMWNALSKLLRSVVAHPEVANNWLAILESGSFSAHTRRQAT